jgi:hypothetical protein
MPAIDLDRDTVTGTIFETGPDAELNLFSMGPYVRGLIDCGAQWADASGPPPVAATTFAATLGQVFWLARNRGWPPPVQFLSWLTLRPPDADPIPVVELDPYDAAVVEAQVAALWAAYRRRSEYKEWDVRPTTRQHPCQ